MLAAILVLSACGWSFEGELTTEASALASLADLRAMRPYWEQIAPRCEGHPSKEDCDDGDMTLFSGLLCAAGERIGCESVRAAQSLNGRFWRSPRRVDGNLGQAKSFSRDMSMGVLLYLASTRDTGAAERWLQWLEDNRPCALENPFTGGCALRGLHRVCRDDENMSCTITPGLWALMGRVWRHLGLERHEEMRLWENADEDMAMLEATFTEPGYQLHLKGVAFFLKKLIGVPEGELEEAADLLLSRQPDNPFFRFLVEGASPAVIERVAAVCPRMETHATTRRHQWSWERADESEAWRESMGWDCIFLDDLLQRSTQLN